MLTATQARIQTKNRALVIQEWVESELNIWYHTGVNSQNSEGFQTYTSTIYKRTDFDKIESLRQALNNLGYKVTLTQLQSDIGSDPLCYQIAISWK